MAENPFPDTWITDWTFLDDSGPRNQCPHCNKSRKYYCYTCCVPLPHLRPKLPKVKLPIKVDIIKHPSEIDGKSTCPHAAILAPEDVVVHTYPCIPDYNREKVLLVFPGEQSVSLEDLASLFSRKQSVVKTKDSDDQTDTTATTDINGTDLVHSSIPREVVADTTGDRECVSTDNISKDTSPIEEGPDLQKSRKRNFADTSLTVENVLSDDSRIKQMRMSHALQFERVVFIDSTWNQTQNIINDERLKDLKRVELQSRTTNFWRCHDGKPLTYLSTIEAIYYFMKDFHTLFLAPEYNHEYDDLLFFFCFMYNKIRQSHQGGKNLKAYQRS